MTTFDKIMSNKETKTEDKRKFIVYTEFGEILDVAIQLQEEGCKVLLYVENHDYKSIGTNIVEKIDNWFPYIGQDFIWVVDSCSTAKLQDWLRKRGEAVVGTNEVMSEYENDRQFGQEWFKDAGFKQPDSHNFTDIDDAIEFVKENKKNRYILKQNGDLPKHLNHLSKFSDGIDMIFHLEELKKTWKETEWGAVDFDLMEVVEGVEMACSAYFNGHDWLRNKDGKVVGWLNQEYKKQSDGDLGETTGEMGTVFIGVTEDDETFADILLRPKIVEKLKETNYHGAFDINGSITDDGYVAFEATSRFGIPATSYEFIAGINTSTADILEYMARGIDKPIDIHEGIGIVSVVVAKPFPLDADVDDSATSIGEKLWIIGDDKEPIDDFTDDQMKHIHLENFKRDDDGNYRVASKSGYLLTCTMRGGELEKTRDKLIEYIKDNLFISGMIFRQDLGRNLIDYI
jgi:phosphoribosylamine-glycine ligase